MLPCLLLDPNADISGVQLSLRSLIQRDPTRLHRLEKLEHFIGGISAIEQRKAYLHRYVLAALTQQYSNSRPPPSFSIYIYETLSFGSVNDRHPLRPRKDPSGKNRLPVKQQVRPWCFIETCNDGKLVLRRKNDDFALRLTLRFFWQQRNIYSPTYCPTQTSQRCVPRLC